MAKARKQKFKSRKFSRALFIWWSIQLGLASVAVIFFVNIGLHLYNQPLEILSWIPGQRTKTPDEIWRSYEHSFKNNEGGIVTAPMLAALVLVESGGDPFARPQWRFQWNTDLTRLYTPASSAFGIMQITRGTMKQAEALCENDPMGCGSWLNTRANPTHSIAVGSQYLKHHTARLASTKNLNYDQRVALVATTHLCGPGRAHRILKQNFKITDASYCGSHSLKSYVQKVKKWTMHFDDLDQKFASNEQGHIN